ncbi:uncharacterized protein [Glycine max]|uniref:uncharacterized protein n=1 Tax=Glycine max TaxID=3847 RepID=UPI000E21B88A|nr:uncharacterized protein LOC113001220 [Glycine max]|eukprot:XP_025983818.1 uncharacterized protein LOC113001220 [Glycine max]
MEMSNLASKLKAVKLELSEDLLVHLVFISLPTHFGQFKVSYNTQKDKWSLNELISHCVQEEKRLQRDRFESAHLSSTSQNKKRKKTKGVVEGSFQQKKPKKDERFTCYFCKKSGQMKKKCPKYATWRVKKGKSLALVCSEVNLAFVPKDTWWVDFGATTHLSVTMSGCLWSQLPSGDERFIFVGDGKKVAVEAIGAFRLQQYFISFIDDYSRYGYLYLIHEKSQSLDVFKSFKAEVELQLGKKIKAIKSDRGGEYYDRYDGSGEQSLGSFALFLKECGIVPQYTMSGKPSMNGVAERRN